MNNSTRWHWWCAILGMVMAFVWLAPRAVAQEAASAKTAPHINPQRPQLATGAAIAPDGRLWVVGLTAQAQLFVQSTPLGGAVQWREARILNTGTDPIAADGESRPKIAFGPNNWAVISYTMPLAKPYTGFIRMLHSSDGGQSFGAAFTVHQDRQEITHRFESVAFDAQGVLHTLWVDKRDQPPKGSAQKYAGAAIYRNESKDGGQTFGPDTKLADHSCECCRIGLAPNPQGQLQATWRHVFAGGTRDHAFASVAAPANRITRSTHDDWQINACPHHGPGLALNAGSTQSGYHTVWFGIRKVKGQDQAAVRYARLNAQGEPLPDTVRVLPDPRAEHADVLADGKNVAVVWRSSEGAVTTLKAWLSKDGGQTFAQKTLGQVTGYNDHPRLAQNGSRRVVVWRNAQEIQVHELEF
ncbi:hypothetical protein [Limnohabitans sp. 2KL-17]|uniref:hypothetical protein n=1 Tax=Limnohabitans sp. 2KL-17 TaxID=1100704 RepID=UPI001E4AAB57|nr:hypothetical protein [Limnohabitans sp. 2KL-17]